MPLNRGDTRVVDKGAVLGVVEYEIEARVYE